jgi:alkanesulfonate monooxygenase SsuD/methylene tetrahydromethanopterin reductase-like flavin-dependent oxidoreductase (luciferase family)
VGGGGTRRTTQLAARFADEFNIPFASLEATLRQFQRVRAACEVAGRDPAGILLSAAQTICCGATRAEVARRAAAIGRDPGDLRANAVAGTPNEVVAQLQTFADAGASRAYLQVLDLDDLEHLDLLAAEVAPQLS